MKKIVALVLSAIMAIALCACGGSGGGSAETPAAGGGEATTAAAPAPAPEITTAAAGQAGAAQAEMEQKAEVAGKDFLDYTEFGDEAIIDTSRKSTANSDEKYPEMTLCSDQEIKSWTAWQTGRGRNEMVMVVWEPLAYNCDGYVVEPCLAKDYHWKDENNKTDLIVEIYDYIHDTDGNKITSSDVKFSIEQAMGANIAGEYAQLDHVDIIDDYTVDIVWKQPCKSIIPLTTVLFTAIASEKAFNEHNFVDDPCGTGTYYLDSQVQGSKYVLKRNEDYWQKPELCCSVAHNQGNVDTINIEFIGDDNMRYMALENGETFNYKVNSNNIGDFMEGGKHYGEYTVIYERNSGRYGVSFNVSGQAPSGIVNDVNFRKAVFYAIDGPGIIKALGEYGCYQVHGEAGVTARGYNPEWDTKTDNYYAVYDTALAKEYLDKTDYNGEELIFLVQSGQQKGETAAQIIQQELDAIGIKVKLMPLEMSVLQPTKNDFTQWDMWFFMWAGDDIGQQWARQLDINSYETGYNENGMNQDNFPGFQEMIEQVQTDDRTPELIDEIQNTLEENAIQYSIFGEINYWALNKDMAMIRYSSNHKDYNWGACDYYLD